MLSLLGIFVVLRRIVLVGAALAQVSAAGLALAIFASEIMGSAFLHDHPESMALVTTLAGAAVLSIRPKKVNLPAEGAIGVGFALASTLAILLVALARKLPAARLHIIQGAGHVVMVDARNEFNKAVADFIEHTRAATDI